MPQKKKLTYSVFEKNFPFHRYAEMRKNQSSVFEIIGEGGNLWTFELPTGSGKTDIAGTFLLGLRSIGVQGALWYTAPTKTLVEQFSSFFPEAAVLYGRNEYPCLFYKDRGKAVNAADSPCHLLECPHRVSQETGQVEEKDASPCPYLQAKWIARQRGLVACTTAFYLVSRVYQGWPETVGGLVADEAHQWAQVARSVFRFDITDYQLKRAIKMLTPIDADQAEKLQNFLDILSQIASLKPARRPTILADHEIRILIQALNRINLDLAEAKIRAAVASQKIDPVAAQEDLKVLETIARNVQKYIHALTYAVGDAQHNPWNYVYAYCRKRVEGREKVKYALCIRGHYVAPLIRKRVLGGVEYALACSATIGNPQVFGIETGIEYPFHSFPSEFPIENTRVYLPSDTPDLAYKPNASRAQRTEKALQMITQAALEFRKTGHRSLVIVVSDEERKRFLEIAEAEGLKVISYGNGVNPRQAVASFKQGVGDILVGTAANYSHGIDLPKQIAPVIFFLRPSRSNPNEPVSQFERERFKNNLWAILNWRAMQEAMQVRGRNMRSAEDLGVTFFISQQFGGFLKSALPEWLLPAYRNGMTMAEYVDDGLNLLGRQEECALLTSL